MAALVWSAVPSPAWASGYSVNPCLDMYSYLSWLQDDVDEHRVGMCTPGTSGLFPIFNNNIVRPIVDMMTNYLSNQNVGGPVSAYRERVGQAPSQADVQRLARWVDGRGPGLAAGYTPTETTGQFIQRHLQPLRDHHLNGWFNFSWSNPEDDHGPTRYDSDIFTVTLGADMPLLNDQLLFGVFGSFTDSEVDTEYNNGGVDSKLGTIGPYFQYSLNDYVSFDVTVAGVFGQHENTIGIPAGAGGGSAPKARGEQWTDGFFLSMNANGNYWIGNWGVQGRVGFLHSDMETDHYTLSSGGVRVGIPELNNELTQFSLASQVNYFYDQGLPYFESVKAMPYARLTFNYDIDHDNIQLPPGVSQHPNDDDEINVSWGVTLFGDSAFSGSVEAGRTLGRSDFDSWNFSGTVNYAF